jgi:tRNA modification GTPase
VTLLDTAGLRDAAEEIEAEGVRRALARAAEADFRIALFDATARPVVDGATAALVDMHTIPVLNKIDAVSDCADVVIAGRRALPVSVHADIGIDRLLAELRAAVERSVERASPAPPLTRQRHRRALEECRDALRRAGHATQTDLLAEDVRLAARALCRITGRVDVEDLLDVIFRDFCIGK